MPGVKRQPDRRFGVPGTPSKWRATSNQHGALAARVPALELGRGDNGGGIAAAAAAAAAAAGPGALKDLCVDKENALMLLGSMDEELELEKSKCEPCSPDSNAASEMDAAWDGDGGGRDPLGSRRKRIEEVCAHPPSPA
jgi:hypothetical protein